MTDRILYRNTAQQSFRNEGTKEAEHMKLEDHRMPEGDCNKHYTGYLILYIAGFIFLALICLILYGTVFGIREGIKQTICEIR